MNKLLQYLPYYWQTLKASRSINTRMKQLIYQRIHHNEAWKKSLSKDDLFRIKQYVLIQTLWGNSFCALRKEKITATEMDALIAISAISPLYDDFFDKVDTPEKRIIAVVADPFNYQPHTPIEALFAELLQVVYNSLKDTGFFTEMTQALFQAQKNSKKLTTASLDKASIKEIAFAKGGYSVLVIRSLLNHPMKDKEFEALYQLGGVAQFIDDIFDMYEDYQENRQTLANTYKDIQLLKQDFLEEVNHTHALFYQLDYETKAIQQFLHQVMLLGSAALVCIAQFEKLQEQEGGHFEIQHFSRKQLICDMEKVSNLFRMLKYSIRYSLREG